MIHVHVHYDESFSKSNFIHWMYSLLFLISWSFPIVASYGLHVDHSVVVTLLCHQLFVCANLGHFASVDHGNDVSILDGGHAMGYHYGGTICEQGRGGRREAGRGREGGREGKREGGGS